MNRTFPIRLELCVPCLAIIFGSTAYPQETSGAAAKKLFDAIRKGEVAQVKNLLNKDPSLAKACDEKGRTATLFAVYAEHKDIAELLIASGVQHNIFEAAATSRVERVRELLKEQPDLIHAYSTDGWTALYLNFGNLDIVKLLLDNGADINAISKNGFVATPLQGSVVMKNSTLGKLLLDRGANVSPRGEGGTSPLQEAAGSGQIEFARLLLERGADANARDDAGKTPRTIALDYKQPEIANLLREHGAVQ
jgi:ankyrin repeat protein